MSKLHWLEDKCLAVAEMSDHLAIIDMGRKLGAVPLLGGAGSPPNTLSPGPKPAPKWHLDPFSHLDTIDMGQKVRGCCAPFLRRGASPHLTQCGQGQGLPPYQVSSWFILLFGHNTPTLQRGQTERQRSDSIGWTILQTVTQKLQL